MCFEEWLGKGFFLEEQNLRWILKDEKDVVLQTYGGDGEENGMLVYFCRQSITADSLSAEQMEKDMQVRELGRYTESLMV